MQIKNQHQQTIYYLFTLENFSLKDVINDSMFFKFQTRLSEIENDLGYAIATRTRKSFINKFGRKSTYNLYNAIDKAFLLDLIQSY